MPFPVLTHKVSQANYQATDGTEVVALATQGGPARRRRDTIGASTRVRCSWALSQTAHEAFMTFHDVTLRRGSLPFQVDLILDGATVVTHQAWFVANTLRLQSVKGGTRNLVAELEVRPIDDPSGDAAYLTSFEASYQG